MLLEPAYLGKLVATVNRELGDRNSLLASERASLDVETKKKRGQVERLLDAVENGEEGIAALRERLATRQREPDQLRGQRLTLDLEDAAVSPNRIEIERVLPYVENLKATLGEASVRTRRFILKSFIKEIMVARDSIAIEFSFPQEARLPDESENPALSMVTPGTPDRSRNLGCSKPTGASSNSLRVRMRELAQSSGVRCRRG